jgi:predicted ArsR family transcriptional regulator
MAVHRHARDLEGRGLVERFPVRQAAGRPRLALRLSRSATNMFPRAYAGVSCAALKFIEDKLGRAAVEDALRARQREVMPAYKAAAASADLGERVEAIARLRDQEGYMAEARSLGKGGFEILEHNCPIFAVAEQFGEACAVEQDMFRKVLRAKVETTHRVVAGAHVCRFVIAPKEVRG